MNMRIDSNGVESLTGKSSFGSVSSVRPELRADSTGSAAHGEDRVSLSSASSLIAMAKTSVGTDRQARISALTAQVRSGQYRPDLSEVGRAIVQASSGDRGGSSL